MNINIKNINKHCPICNGELKFKLTMSYYESEVAEKYSKVKSNLVKELQNMFFNSKKETETIDVDKTQIIEVNDNNFKDCYFSEQGLHINLVDKIYYLDEEENVDKQKTLTYFDEMKFEANCFNEQLQANEYYLNGSIYLSEVFENTKNLKKIEDDLQLLNTNETRKINAIKAFHKLNTAEEKPTEKVVSDINLKFDIATIFEIEEDKTVSIAKITNIYFKYKTIINIKSNQLDKLNIEQEQRENGKIISDKIEQELTDLTYWKLNNPHKALTRIKMLFTLR